MLWACYRGLIEWRLRLRVVVLPPFRPEIHVARYFFHVRDEQTFPDLQGTELANLDVAKREAVRFAGALLAEKPETFWQASEWTMRVTDDRDLTLFQLTFFASGSPATQ